MHFLSLDCHAAARGQTTPGVSCTAQETKLRRIDTRAFTGRCLARAQLNSNIANLSGIFEFGAFADDHQDRNRLGPFARARAKEKHGREFSASEIDVIGDTPRDIACGKAFGARTIAVATGTWSREQLAKYQPDFLIDDLSNVDAIIDTLGW